MRRPRSPRRRARPEAPARGDRASPRPPRRPPAAPRAGIARRAVMARDVRGGRSCRDAVCHGHDLARYAVSDRRSTTWAGGGRGGGRAPRSSRPERTARWPGRCPDHRHRAVERAAGHHPRLHGRESPAPRPRRWPYVRISPSGRCWTGGPGDREAPGPHRAGPGRPGTTDGLTIGVTRVVQGHPLVVGQPLRRRQAQQRTGAVQVVNAGRGDTGHIRSKTSRTSPDGVRSRTWSGVVPRRLPAASAVYTSVSSNGARRCAGGSASGPPSRSGRSRRRSGSALVRRTGRSGPPRAGAPRSCTAFASTGPCGASPLDAGGLAGISGTELDVRHGRQGPPARRRPRRATATPGRCSGGTPGWARGRARPGRSSRNRYV